MVRCEQVRLWRREVGSDHKLRQSRVRVDGPAALVVLER